jgi:hypothetical protein
MDREFFMWMKEDKVEVEYYSHHMLTSYARVLDKTSLRSSPKPRLVKSISLLKFVGGTTKQLRKINREAD